MKMKHIHFNLQLIFRQFGAVKLTSKVIFAEFYDIFFYHNINFEYSQDLLLNFFLNKKIFFLNFFLNKTHQNLLILVCFDGFSQFCHVLIRKILTKKQT